MSQEAADRDGFEQKPKLKLTPLAIKEANEFILKHHRHHKEARGHKFSIGVVAEGSLVGAAIISRPIARALDYRRIAEITRLATDGTYNACSILYAAAARAAKAMGYERIQTYILETEPGTSLKAAGWDCDGQLRRHGKGWNNRENRRTDQPTGPKIRWSKNLNGHVRPNEGD